VLREHFAFLMSASGLQFRHDLLMEKRISAICIAFRIPHQLMEGERKRIFINVLQVLLLYVNKMRIKDGNESLCYSVINHCNARTPVEYLKVK
jgi:hypothetical protein